MPNKKNIEQVKSIVTQLNAASGVVFVDYKGLTHNQLEILRNQLQTIGSDLLINKNTLLSVAIGVSDQNAGSEIVQSFHEPTATIYLATDYQNCLKVLTDFAKQNDLLVFKGGVIDKRAYTGSEVKSIANLPSRETLVAQLLGQLNAPLSQLVSVLAANQRNLVYALNQIAISKGGE